MALESREVSKRLKNYHETSDEDADQHTETEESDVDNEFTSEGGSTDLSGLSSGGEILNGDGDEGVRLHKRKKKKRHHRSSNPKLNFKCVGYWKENHGHPIFGVSINHHLPANAKTVFATVGYNRVTVYEALRDGIKLVQCYADPDTDENFYTCAWSYDGDTGRPILAAGGIRGIIRLFSPANMACIRHFMGHGNAINELKFHPRDPNLLLSVSKDHALRLWNVKTEHNIVVFGGVDGHRDEVLSADFNMDGTKIISCGMDHSLKLWHCDTPEIQAVIKLSYTHSLSKNNKKVFPTELCHFPDLSTRDIHRNYVDCCKWFGDFVLSKSCENTIVCWKPGHLEQENKKKTGTGLTEPDNKLSENKVTVIHKIGYKDCEIWFVRFSMDVNQRLLALGNQRGKIYIWDMEVDEPSLIKHTVLSHPKCNVAIRQTSLSRDGNILIYGCDDGTVWRWDRQELQNPDRSDPR